MKLQQGIVKAETNHLSVRTWKIGPGPSTAALVEGRAHVVARATELSALVKIAFLGFFYR
jgi:hypothetical protein